MSPIAAKEPLYEVDKYDRNLQELLILGFKATNITRPNRSENIQEMKNKDNQIMQMMRQR